MIRIEDEGRTPTATWPSPRVETGWLSDTPDSRASEDWRDAIPHFVSPPPAPWPRVFPGL